MEDPTLGIPIQHPETVFFTRASNNTTDRIFLLSIVEAQLLFLNNQDRLAHDLQGTNASWWLRTPGGGIFRVANVMNLGGISFDGAGVFSPTFDGLGIRPAMWINLAH